MTQIAVTCGGEGFLDYSQASEESLHSAGYDAFITGSAYYMMSKIEGAEEVLEEFKNKIRLGTSRLFVADFENAEEDQETADVAPAHLRNPSSSS